MPKIDDIAYAHGRSDFAQGVSLRAIYEQSAAADDGRYNEEGEAREFSRLLGFADALIEQLRRPIVFNVGDAGLRDDT